jgi:hypothetical protein
LNTYGKRVLDRVEILEMGVLPSDRDYAAFVKPFPKGVDNAITTQARSLEGVIARELNVPREAVSGKVLNDKAFFNHAFAVCDAHQHGRECFGHRKRAKAHVGLATILVTLGHHAAIFDHHQARGLGLGHEVV